MCAPHRGKASHPFLKHDLTFKPFGFQTLNSIPLPGQLVLAPASDFTYLEWNSPEFWELVFLTKTIINKSWQSIIET